MKILQINKFYYQRGGAERVMFDLTKLLEKHGHQIIPFSMKHPKNKKSKYEKYFLENVEYKSSELKFFKKISRTLYSFEAKRKLDALIKKTKPDIAHIHNIYHHISPSILHTLAKHNIPAVMSIHDFKLVCPNYLLDEKSAELCKRGRYYNAVRYKWLNNSYAASTLAMVEMYIHKATQIYEKNIKTFIAPSKFVKEVLVDFGQDPQQITVLPHFYTPGMAKKAKKSKNTVLYFGRLSYEKGVDILLKSAYNNKISFDIHIAGEGPQKEDLKALVKERKLSKRVKFLGHLNDDALKQEIAQATCVIIPSRVWETFSLAALESFEQATPVIAANHGALPERVHDGKNGLLFKPGDEKDLAKKIEWMLSHEKDVEKMGKSARELLKKEYDSKEYYKKIIALYTKALKE